MAKTPAWQRKGIGKNKLSVKKGGGVIKSVIKSENPRLADFTFDTGCTNCVDNSFYAHQLLRGEKNG
jgi:hypothetical protein